MILTGPLISIESDIRFIKKLFENIYIYEIVTRFAPSPTGNLHLGHAYSVLIAEREARLNNGKFLLRIEDIDIERCTRFENLF